LGILLKNPKNQSWWLDYNDLVNQCDPLKGLDETEVDLKLRKYGLNTVRANQSKSLIIQFLSRFKNPLVIVLILASFVSALTGESTNFLIISCIVLLSVILDFVQEFKANKAADALRQSVSVRAIVLRNYKVKSISVQNVVPGDIVFVKAGDLIPADSLVLSSKDFFVNQSLLTGESFPIEKSTAQLPTSAKQINEASNAVFMGTSVVGGQAHLLVIKTGMETSLGDIADSIEKPSVVTSFETGTRKFGMLIMWLTVVMVLFVLLINSWFDKPWLESFLFAVALAVGLTPELLPMVVSITLSRGAIRLSRLKLIVKRQSSIQDLGSMDVFCTDKTGTLTEAKIRFEKSFDAYGNLNTEAIELAYLNSYFESGLRNSIDEAILEVERVAVGGWTKIDEVPFDFERRCVSILIASETRHELFLKGAFEEVISKCEFVKSSSGASRVKLDRLGKEKVLRYCRYLESDGLRVLAIARKEIPIDHCVVDVKDEFDLDLVGFVTFIDPPKQSASSALEKLRNSGVSIKIVTGDSDLVTQNVCRQLHIEIQGVLLGQEIDLLDDRALQHRVNAVNLFCKVNPSQKKRVILAFRSNGHVVGYLGDGINDAPSLHCADVGISVDTAADVAKAAADMILLEQNLNVVHAGVLEGRRTFGNIMKYIMMGTSSNFGNMFSMAGASLFLPFLPMLPTQILLNNILYDLSEIPIPLDEVDSIETASPKVLDLDFIRNFMFVVGSISSLFDFLTFYFLLNVFDANEKSFQTGWFIESLCTQVLVVFVIRTRGSPFKSRPHPLLIITSIFIVMLGMLLPMSPIGVYFGFSPPTIAFYGFLVSMVLIYLLIVQIVKSYFFRYQDKKLALT